VGARGDSGRRAAGQKPLDPPHYSSARPTFCRAIWQPRRDARCRRARMGNRAHDEVRRAPVQAPRRPRALISPITSLGPAPRIFTNAEASIETKAS